MIGRIKKISTHQMLVKFLNAAINTGRVNGNI